MQRGERALILSALTSALSGFSTISLLNTSSKSLLSSCNIHMHDLYRSLRSISLVSVAPPSLVDVHAMFGGVGALDSRRRISVPLASSLTATVSSTAVFSIANDRRHCGQHLLRLNHSSTHPR